MRFMWGDHGWHPVSERRVEMGRWETRFSLVPWWLADSDLREANGGELELERSTLVNGRAEKHIAMHVWGQADLAPSLGLVAIRGERQGDRLTVPLTICIPETPMVLEMKPAMDMALLSGPRRTVEYRATDYGEQ